MAERYVGIVDGPSKWDLMLGLFDSNNSNERLLEFVLETKEIINVKISGVQHEDGSGSSWNIEAYSRPRLTSGGPVKIYFSTVSRRGTLIHSEPYK